MRLDTLDFKDSTRDQINARRNYLLGLWAGSRLGLKADALSGYAAEVMEADFEEPGPQDVIRKIKRDFDHNGVAVCELEITERLKFTDREVRAELLSTD